MAEWGYEDDWGATYDPSYYYAGGSPTFDESGGGYNPDFYSAPMGPGLGWDASSYPGGGMSSLSLEDQVRQAIAGRPDLYGSASQPQGWLASVLGSLGGLGGAGGLAGILGPALSAAGGIAGGAIGSNASNEAARLQAAALNRGIDLQTAQWLQQQGNLAPYLQAGQQGLSALQQLAGREAPGFQDPAAAISGAHYPLPSTTPGWQPQMYQGPQGPNAGDYRWTPQQGPQAAHYRYAPGAIPQASQYRYTPGAVPTLQGAELLANDPGVQFRLDEGRKALEASALAKGMGMSGATMSALQRQGQELSSQEYANAWNRASQQAQLREQWGQAASQLGWQQAEGEARLREQVNQIASQQGWTQAQAEAVFREQQAQLASQQGWTQALQGQQTTFNQGLDTSKWNTLQQQQYAQEQYKNMLEQSKWRYGQDVSQNQTDYDRAQALYKQRLAAHLLPWEQQGVLANLGGQAVGMYGQQGQGATTAISNLLGQVGTAQGQGALSQGNAWSNALTNVGGAANSYMQNQSYLQGLQGLLGGLNR